MLRKRWCNAARRTGRRNVLEHLPKNKQARVKRRLNAAWRENNPTKARQKLLRLAEELEKDHPRAAVSLKLRVWRKPLRSSVCGYLDFSRAASPLLTLWSQPWMGYGKRDVTRSGGQVVNRCSDGWLRTSGGVRTGFTAWPDIRNCPFYG